MDERGTHKTTKPHPHKHKHGERIEIWIGADGTSREDHGEEPDVDDLEKMDAVEVLILHRNLSKLNLLETS